MYYYKLGVMLGSEYEIRNYGHSARTMLREPIEGVSYWISPMFTDSQAWNPDIVSIMLGTNDAHPNNWPLFAAEYQKDAIDMVTVYKNLPSLPRVILMKVPPARNDGREPALSEVNVILEHVAQVTGVELVDVYSAIDNSHPVPYSENKLYKDPIHLSAISHTIIADLLYNQFINGPVCGGDNCDFGEDQCNCPEDCGTPPLTEIVCDDGIDEDCDTYTDCDDSDCDGDPACPTCGDTFCDIGEDQCNCPEDCGIPPSTEGNCTDGNDDDCDGDTDCVDADCVDDTACVSGPVIFSDDFESGGFSTGGWTIVDGAPTVHEQAPYTGVYGVKFQRFASIEKYVSTAGSNGIVVEYDRITLNYDPEDFFEVEWFDGTDWHLLEATQDTSWSHASFSLPEGADNNPDFILRFTSNANRPTDKVFLDNVEILD
jgi:hypothetical protein